MTGTMFLLSPVAAAVLTDVSSSVARKILISIDFSCCEFNHPVVGRFKHCGLLVAALGWFSPCLLIQAIHHK